MFGSSTAAESGVKRFAELLDALLFPRRRATANWWLMKYFATTPDPERLGLGGLDRRTVLC